MTAVNASAGGIDITCAVGDDCAVAFKATTLDWSTVTVTTGITLNGTIVSTDFTHTVSTTTTTNDTLTLSLTDAETTALGLLGKYRYFVQTTVGGITDTWFSGLLLLTTPDHVAASSTASITFTVTTAPSVAITVVAAVASGGGGGGAVDSVNGHTGTVVLTAADVGATTAAAVAAAYQPLDSDLTAIAALTTTVFGRALLTQADATATRTTLGLGTAATTPASAYDASGAAAAAQAASQPLDSDLTAIAALATTVFGRALLTMADAAATITALGLAAIYQPLDSDLTALAALAATGVIARTGAGTVSARTITGTTNRVTVTNGDGVAGNPTLDVGSNVYVSGGTDVAVLDGGTGSSTAAGARANLGLVINTDVSDVPTAKAETLIIAVGDETTAITTGTAKVTFRMPFAFTLSAVRASLTTASSVGLPTVNIKESGVTILSTKLTIDATELTSTTAATPAVISDSAIADDAQMTIDIDVAGTGAAGLKVYLIGTRA
jgi:hypothetical protein